VKELFGYTSPKQLADLLGHRLAHHYGWKSVDIYFVDTSAQKFKLLAHDGTSEGFNPQAFEQDLDAGILGYVYRTGEDLNIADVSSDQGFKGADTKMRPYTLSVLCMPVRVDGQIRALLNIEDNLRSAFSRDEQVLLRNLLDELGSLLAAAETQSLIVQTFRATPSAVFVTDSNGKIMRTNPAASALLGHEPAELVNRSISHYFVDCEDPRKLLKSGSPEIETGLKTNTGRIVPVLAGVHELQGFDAWVISAKDISYRKRLEQLEMLGQMYRELAAQMKTPLTLISGWLRRLRKQKETSDPATADVITRTLAQVKKLDITFDRLAFYDQNSGFAPYNEILLDIPKLLDRIVAELPQSEFASVVRNGGRNTGAYVRGDAYRITFIIETILSYLFRFLPQDDQIKVDVASGVEAVEITISGWFPAPNHSGDEPDVTPEGIREALNDMALGEQVITRFMAELHGRYSKTQSEDGELRFILNFPKARVEV
jgi:PAS domain S-box-containing protein